MAEIKAGVVTAAQLEGGMSSPKKGKWLDLNSPATWSLIWFAVAVLFLLIV